MSKYILELTDKDPKNNQTVLCGDAREANKIKKKAKKMGFQVSVKREEKKC